MFQNCCYVPRGPVSCSAKRMTFKGRVTTYAVARRQSADTTKLQTDWWLSLKHHGPLARYVKLWVVHAPGMPGTVSRSPRVSDPDMHHGTAVTVIEGQSRGTLIFSSMLWVDKWWFETPWHQCDVRSDAESHNFFFQNTFRWQRRVSTSHGLDLLEKNSK